MSTILLNTLIIFIILYMVGRFTIWVIPVIIFASWMFFTFLYLIFGVTV